MNSVIFEQTKKAKIQLTLDKSNSEWGQGDYWDKNKNCSRKRELELFL